MKVKIPKDLVGASYATVMPLVFAEFNTDTFLPSLFFKVMSSGKSYLRSKNDATNIGMYVDKLANHHLLSEFQTPDGRRVLEKFVRIALITTSTIGRAQRGEQMISITPYSLLSYKPGFIAASSRQRGVDTFIYSILREHLRAGGPAIEAQEGLKHQMIGFFGKGLQFERPPSTEATYDGQTDLDTMTRISLAFIDGFTATGFGRDIDISKPSPCPVLTTHIAQDILKFLNTYSERMPSQALTYNFQALIGFEMYIYSLRLTMAVNQLVQNPDELPLAMQPDATRSFPQLYLDFTGRPNHLSQQMAAECVRRDVETFQHFFRSILQLRWLEKQVLQLKTSPGTKARITQLLQDKPSGADYLQIILQMRDDPLISDALNADARHAITTIRKATFPEEYNDEVEELQWFYEIMESATTDIDQLVLLLEEGQRQSVLKNYVGWIMGTGGMSKAYGLISGVARQRRTWRYAPGNDLLSLLVQLATAHAIPNDQGGGAAPREIRLQEFLFFLESRYGIIVDRPPPGMHGAEYSAAARDNLRAMLGRLRQMGMFTDLSDDFTVQRLRPPYGALDTSGQERR